VNTNANNNRFPLFEPQNTSKKDLKEIILSDVEIPSHEPIILSNDISDIPPGFISLCKKGPSFIPTPKHVDWFELQTDFDNFCNTIRLAVNNHNPEADKTKDTNKACNLDNNDFKYPLKHKVTMFAACQVFEVNTSDAAKGNLKELESIAAAVIGGVVLTGGFGTVLGILLGAVIFGIAKEAFFYIPGIDGSFYRVFLGAVLVSAALTNENIRKRIIGSV
jgi:hypothetical protein